MKKVYEAPESEQNFSVLLNLPGKISMIGIPLAKRRNS